MKFPWKSRACPERALPEAGRVEGPGGHACPVQSSALFPFYGVHQAGCGGGIGI